jgi:hypothetical protein
MAVTKIEIGMSLLRGDAKNVCSEVMTSSLRVNEEKPIWVEAILTSCLFDESMVTVMVGGCPVANLATALAV